jgi:hypothetical protein
VASVVISAYNRCSVPLYPQLFVGGPMSYLRYLCLLAYSGVQLNPYCVFCLYSSCVSYAASFSGLSIVDGPIGII